MKKEDAMIPEKCWNCGSTDIQINWKMNFTICRKCQYGGTIAYAINPKEWKKWKNKRRKIGDAV